MFDKIEDKRSIFVIYMPDMKIHPFIIAFILLITGIFSNPAVTRAAEYLVGPGQAYLFPADVAGLVNDGDTVTIAAGLYTGAGACAAWTNNDLLLRGSGGFAHMEAAGAYVWGKGIWVCAGNNIRVEHIEFSGAAVPDHNGAGIRLDGSGLTVRECYFHDNENGILGGNSGNILIEHSEFEHNGYGDGYTHNLYINHAQSLTVRFCYLHHAHIGHELKSRACENYILFNRISNELTGDASREIDLPNGGTALIIGNIIQQGPNTQNGNMIAFGAEGLSNPAPHRCCLIHNTLIDERGFGGLMLDLPVSGMDLFMAKNNILVSATAVLMSGSPTMTDTSNNVLCQSKSNLFFADTLNYDYHLTSGSTLLIDAGTDAGFLDTISLTPAWEYVHPLQMAPRLMINDPDPGAYEYQGTQGTGQACGDPGHGMSIRDLGNGTYLLSTQNGAVIEEIKVLDMEGSGTGIDGHFSCREKVLDLSNLASGTYLVMATSSAGRFCLKLVHYGR